MNRNRNSAGDTIVEVLIALAVISAVLAATFSLVNHSLANARQSQEHGEALKIAEAQLEQLKNKVANGTILTAGGAYCIDSSGGLMTFPSGTFPQPTDTNYPGGCKGLGSVNYRTVLVSDISDASGKTVRANVDWDGAVGGQDHISLIYRLY